jgi:glycerol-3-phosphate dehydrogenase (NAD(P)+)
VAKVTVLGEGTWGSAIAQLLAFNGHEVMLWCHDSKQAQFLNKQTDSPIQATDSLSIALAHAPFIFEAIPVKFLRWAVQQTAPCAQNHTWISLSKGIEQDTLLFPTQIIQDLIPNAPCVALSGPSYAQDVVRQEPTLVTLAGDDPALSKTIADFVVNKNFRVEYSTDLIGVQACAAYKNVAALALGMLEGMGHGHNTRTFAFMRALEEMAILVKALGGQQDTIYGPAGVGDLALTALGGQSKNRALGVKLGQGLPLEKALTQLTGIPESVNTVASFSQLEKRHNLSLPLSQTVYAILYAGKPVSTLLNCL